MNVPAYWLRVWKGLPVWGWGVIVIVGLVVVLRGTMYFLSSADENEKQLRQEVDYDLAKIQRDEAEVMVRNAIADVRKDYESHGDQRRATQTFDVACKKGAYTTDYYTITQAVATGRTGPKAYDVKLIVNPRAGAAASFGSCYVEFRWSDDEIKLEWH